MKVNTNYPDLNRILGKPEKLGRTNDSQENKASFGEVIRDFLHAVNNSQIEADEKIKEVVQGNSSNLIEAMTTLEESSLSFQLMLEIRNKLLESYQEINRIQI